MIVGARFKRWTVVGIDGLMADCRCECGSHGRIWIRHLRSGASGSCGCLAIEAARRRGFASRKHGGWKTSEYRVWGGIKARCFNVNSPVYRKYGARGITMCERWRRSFAAFLADMGPRPSPAHSIDRFPDGDGNYEPGNCRWATARQQNVNRKTVRLVTINGRTLCVAEWAREIGISEFGFAHRVKNGWSDERLLQPSSRRR